MRQWVDCEFDRRDFRDEDLSQLRTERVVFSDCDFGGANLTESLHRGSAFRNCTFRRTLLWHATFAQCSMLGSVFEQCRLRPITFDEVDFTLAVLGGNDFRGLDLSGCRLRETGLVDADLRKAVLRGADLTGARTTGTRLDDADLRGATADPSLWRTAALSGARVDVDPGVDPEWWTPDWQDCWTCGNGVGVSGKRRKYTPEFREQDARLVIKSGHPWRMWPPRSVSVDNCWGVGCGLNAKPSRPAILARCSMPTKAWGWKACAVKDAGLRYLWGGVDAGGVCRA